MAETAPISLQDTGQDQQAPLIDLSLARDPQPNLPDDVVTKRASKATFGLLDQVPNKPYDTYYRSILNGQENQTRREIASTLDYQRTMQKYDRIQDLARSKGSALTSEDLDKLQNFINVPPADPRSVFEVNYSKKYMDTLRQAPGFPGSWYDTVYQQQPELVEATEAVGSEYLTKKEYARTGRENAEGRSKSQSYFGDIIDRAKEFIPGYVEYNLRMATPSGESMFQGLLGTQLNQLATEGLRLPLPQFKEWFDSNMERLGNKDPGLAVQFAHAVEGQSLTDTVLSNAFTLGDISGIYGVGKGTVKIVRGLATKELDRRELQDITKKLAQSSIGTEKAPPQVVANAAAGDLGEAAVHQATADVMAARIGAGAPEAQALDELTSHLKAQEDNMRATHGRYGQEIVNRVLERARTFRANLEEAIRTRMKVERIPEVVATQDAIRAVKQEFLNDYPGIDSSIININSFLNLEGLRYNEITGTREIVVQLGRQVPNVHDIVLQVGRHTAEYFVNKEEAEGFARMYGLINPQIKQQGFGYYIELSKPLNETSQVSRDFLMSTTVSKAPDSYVNAFLGFLRTPDETLSLEQRLNRKVAAYGGANLMAVAKEEMKSIRALAKWSISGTTKRQQYDQWASVVNYSRRANDPLTGERGYFYQSPAEVGDHYQTFFGRPPSDGEIQAYFSFVRLVEMDAVLRDIGLYRNMSRLGTEHWQVSMLNQGGEEIKSGFFPAIKQNIFPIGSDSILILGTSLGEEKIGVVGGRGFNPKFVNQVRDDIAAGTRSVFRIWDPESRPLKGFLNGDNSRIRYIITSNVRGAENNPLPFSNLSRRGGGHFDYDYDHYIKQARVGWDNAYKKFIYEGDSTIMPMLNRAMGRDVAQALDEVRIALLNRDSTAAKTVAESRIPAIPWKEIQSWFNPTRTPEGELIPARLNKREPIQVIPKGSTIASQDPGLFKRDYYGTTKTGGPRFKDGTREGSDARVHQIKYTQERDAYDLYTMRDEGTHGNPLWKYEPAQLVDPIPTLNRGIKDIVNSTFMDDYKIFSVEHWLKQAESLLKLDNPDSWKSSPFWHFNHAEFKNDADILQVRQLEDARFKIKQFIGTPSKVQNMLDRMSQDLADAMYKKFGPGGNQLTRGLILAPSWTVANLTKPIDLMHYVTYNAVIGLFSPAQILVQSMNYVTMAGIAGWGRATQGGVAALLHQFGRLNEYPDWIAKLDSIASKFGFKPGEFTEARMLGNQSGMFNVGSSHILYDNHYAPKLISNGAQQFLDLGTAFFRGSEQHSRFGAHYIAYKEFRDRNPTGRITNADRAAILDRADLLSGNMSRASKSRIQYGIGSFPSQFMGYQLRLAELFTGSRMGGTGTEAAINRARLFGTFAIAFGVPTATGITTIPFDQYFRKTALENGYVVGDKWWQTTFMEGLPAALGQMATGNVYDVGQRYGAPGMDVFRDVFTGDKPWWNMLGGASFSTLAGAFQYSNGFRTAMMSMIRQDNEAFPMTMETFTEPLKIISSYSAAWKTMAAINTGRWMSRNETFIDRTSPANAIFMGLSGLQSQQAADIQRVTWSLKDKKALEDTGKKEFIRYFHRALRDQEMNPELARSEFAQANAYLVISGYPEEKYHEAIAEAAKDNETLIERLNWDFYLKDIPYSQKENYMRAYNSTTQLYQGRGR